MKEGVRLRTPVPAEGNDSPGLVIADRVLNGVGRRPELDPAGRVVHEVDPENRGPLADVLRDPLGALEVLLARERDAAGGLVDEVGEEALRPVGGLLVDGGRRGGGEGEAGGRDAGENGAECHGEE